MSFTQAINRKQIIPCPFTSFCLFIYLMFKEGKYWVWHSKTPNSFVDIVSVTAAGTILSLSYQRFKPEPHIMRYLDATIRSFSCFLLRQVTLANWPLPEQQASCLRCDLARGQWMWSGLNFILTLRTPVGPNEYFAPLRTISGHVSVHSFRHSSLQRHQTMLFHN